MQKEEVIEFLWEGQDGFFELAYEPWRRIQLDRATALSKLPENRFFASLARKRKGSTKADVADVGNVLWADIDSLDGLQRLDRLPLVPSLTVFSGNKGYWVYLKLSRTVSTDAIEALNQGLAALLDADHCWNRDRIARLPGSIHPQSGKRAAVVSFSAASYDPDQLSFLLEEVPAATARTDTTSDEALSFESVKWPGHPALSDVLWEYIERRPRRGQYGYDRSRVEMSIFSALVLQGWTDQQIIGFANVYRLPRHTQEWARRKDYRWTLRSLEKARVWATESSSGSTSPAGSPPPTTTSTGTSTNTSPMCKRGYTYRHLDRRQVLRLVSGQSTTDLVADIQALPPGCSRQTAINVINQLRDGDLVRVERKGKSVFNFLTGEGQRHAESKLNYLLALPTIRPSSRGGLRIW